MQLLKGWHAYQKTAAETISMVLLILTVVRVMMILVGIGRNGKQILLLPLKNCGAKLTARKPGTNGYGLTHLKHFLLLVNLIYKLHESNIMNKGCSWYILVFCVFCVFVHFCC